MSSSRTGKPSACRCHRADRKLTDDGVIVIVQLGLVVGDQDIGLVLSISLPDRDEDLPRRPERLVDVIHADHFGAHRLL